MQFHRSVLAAALLVWPLAGCNDGSAPATPSAPVAEPSATQNQTPESLSEPYRVITDYLGKSTAEFTVSINDATVGSYNTDKVENDISSYLRPGTNRVKIAWTADNSMNSAEAARLKIQVKRGSEWNDIITREVRKNTAAGESVIDIQAGKPDFNAAPQVVQTPVVEAPVPVETPAAETPAAETPAAETPAAETPATPMASDLSEQYMLKTNFSSLVPGDFNVAINGSSIGSYSTDGNQDVTSYLKKGQNSITIAWKYAPGRPSYSQKSTLTVGVNRNGKWSTVGNVAMTKEVPTGKKTFAFTAR